MAALHLRCHLFCCIAAPDSAILQEWNYLSKRSVTSLSDPTCIFGQHLSLSSNLCHKIMTLLRKKKSIITKGTTESNSLLSLWITNRVRFPTNSDKMSSREPFPVTELHLGLAGQGKPWESPQVSLGSHHSSFIYRCSKDVRPVALGKHRSRLRLPSNMLVPHTLKGNTEAFQFLSWQRSHGPKREVRSLQAGLAEPHTRQHKSKEGVTPSSPSSGKK